MSMNMENIKNKDAPLTVFTPAFNRAYCLDKCYESLKRQTCHDFIWLIVDDGSSDNTRELVEEWIKEDLVSIKYVYQMNQGMHGAHNTAYENCHTELNVCIDSDDYMTDDAVEKILAFWKKHGHEKYSGIIALDITTEGKIIGKELPSDKKSTTLAEYYSKGGKGDKKLIYRTDVMKKYPPYPVFEGEKYVGLSYKYILADQDYSLLIMNEPVCVVEYMEDGSSMNIINQYRKNPRGFAEFRKLAMRYAPSYRDKFRECTHYVASSLILRNTKFLKESPCKVTTFLAVPVGAILYLFIINTGKSTVFKGNR